MAENERNGANTGETGRKGKKKLRILLRTFGCQMNVRDSEFVMGLLIDNGFQMAASPETADVILFNSCSVRKHAEDRLFSNIAGLKELKKAKPDLVIGLMGCTAQNYKGNILRRLPMVDLVCGPSNEADLPGIIADVLKNRRAIVATDKVDEKRAEIVPGYRAYAFKAYVSISEGCDNYCSYCVVPYVRGRERSREEEDIINEVRALAGRGCKEITLIGQNVNSYKSLQLKNGFIRLLEKLNEIEGIERIRFMTSHPKDASAGLFEAMGNLDKVCGHLHLPLQSGSDRILKLMGRGYTASKYMKLADSYKRCVPEGSMTTDIIVGYPSETEGDFEDTLKVMNDVRFDSAFMFKYSARPPAKSAMLKDDVPDEAKGKRFEELLAVQREISHRRNKEMTGRVERVLVDGPSGKVPGLFCGRTRTNKTVTFAGGNDLVGEMVDVRIESATPHVLRGRVMGC